MYQRISIVKLCAFATLCGCQVAESSNKSPLTERSPPAFQVTITTVTERESGKGLEETTPNSIPFANLEEVQMHLHSLDWLSNNKRYEIEILKRADRVPDMVLQIEHPESNPETIEFRFFPDSKNVEDVTRIRFSERLNTEAVTTMIDQVFNQGRMNQPEAEE